MILKEKQRQFKEALDKGNFVLAHKLLSEIDPYANNNYFFFRSFLKGVNDSVRFLLENIKSDVDPQTQRDLMIESIKPFFSYTIKLGRLELIQCVMLFASDNKRKELLNHGNVNPFRIAAENGLNNLLKQFIEYVPALKDQQTLHGAFAAAAKEGKIDTMKYLLSLAPDDSTKDFIIHGLDDNPFSNAAMNNHVHVINYLLELTPGRQTRNNMIHTGNNYPFRIAVYNGNLGLLEKFVKLTPDKIALQEMILSNGEEAVLIAIEKKYPYILDFLLSLTPESKRTEVLWDATNKNPRKLDRPLKKILGRAKMCSDLIEKEGMCFSGILEIERIAKSLSPLASAYKKPAALFTKRLPAEVVECIFQYTATSSLPLDMMGPIFDALTYRGILDFPPEQSKTRTKEQQELNWVERANNIYEKKQKNSSPP